MTPPPPAAPATTRRRSPPNRRRSPSNRHKSLINVVQTVQPLESAIASLPTRNWSAFAATSKAARAIDPTRVDEAFRHRNTPVMKAMLERMSAFSMNVLIPGVQKAAHGLMHTYPIDHNDEDSHLDAAGRLDFVDRFKTFTERMAASVRPQEGMNISFGFFDRACADDWPATPHVRMRGEDVLNIIEEGSGFCKNFEFNVIIEMKHTVQAQAHHLYFGVPVAHHDDAIRPRFMSFPDVSRFDSTGRNWYQQAEVAFIIEDGDAVTEGWKWPGRMVWEMDSINTERLSINQRLQRDEIEAAASVLVFAYAFHAFTMKILVVDPVHLGKALQTLLRKSAYYGKTLRFI